MINTNPIIFLILTAIFCGCEPDKQKLTAIDKLYPIIDKVESYDGNGIRNIILYEIDSCEYIVFINAFQSDFLAHKGNCKYCLVRNKK